MAIAYIRNMIATFSPVDENTWIRKPYFDYFYHGLKTKYNINVHLDISPLINEIKERELKFYPTFIYLITKAINQNDEFRMSFDENGVLGFWNFIVPSYTIFHEDDNTFSDIWSEYKQGFGDFYDLVVADIKTYEDVKGIKVKANQPKNFCPISALPWLSFASISQDTYNESTMLFPIVRFGKYYEEAGKIRLPFSIYVHHAVADGYHTSKLINEIQHFCLNTQEWINS